MNERQRIISVSAIILMGVYPRSRFGKNMADWAKTRQFPIRLLLGKDTELRKEVASEIRTIRKYDRKRKELAA